MRNQNLLHVEKNPNPNPNPNPPIKKEKVLSTTTLFVANLPFSVDDAALLKIFEGFAPQSAHVVRTHSGRSRGYGFVVFVGEKEQLAALNGKNGTSVEGTKNTPTGPVQEVRSIAISISSSVAAPEETQVHNPPTH